MKYLIAYFIILSVFFVTIFSKKRQSKLDADYLDVTTDLGIYRGTAKYSASGIKYFAFRGMRYALPISNRFDESVLFNKSWKGPESVSEYKPDCIGLDNLQFEENAENGRTYSTYGEEDCLFINVHTRSITPKKVVIFFIHGIAFSFGGPTLYRSKYLMDKDVVFVNFAYRVGPLGFLSTGDEIVPGNMGLKDQLIALQWVHKHIGSFGGDPKSISLSGVAAGGASVHFMYLSPSTVGLFKNGYSYSGTALSPWALCHDIPEKTKKLSEYLNCSSTSTKTMVKCLQKIDVRQLLDATARFLVFLFNPFTVFGPIVDTQSKSPYLPVHPEVLLKTGKFLDLPWITGITAENGLHPGAEFLYRKKFLLRLIGKWNEYLPHILYYNKNCSGTIAHNLRKALLFYRQQHKRSFAATFLQMITDRLYTVPAFKSAAYMAKKNVAKAYAYYFLYRGLHTFTGLLDVHSANFDDVVVSNGDDAAYVYYIDGVDMRQKKRDQEMSEEMVNLAVTFAKTSTLPESFNVWKPATPHTQKYSYLEISGPKEYSTFFREIDFLPVFENLLGPC